MSDHHTSYVELAENTGFDVVVQTEKDRMLYLELQKS